MRLLAWLFPTDRDKLLRARRCIAHRDFQTAISIVSTLEGPEAERLRERAARLDEHGHRRRKPEPRPRIPSQFVARD